MFGLRSSGLIANLVPRKMRDSGNEVGLIACYVA